MYRELPVWRSLMYVPVNVEKFVDKAHTRGADVIQLDIEDSVPPAEKANARKLVEKNAARVKRGGADVVVRINQPLSLAVRDLEASICPDVNGIAVTKVSGVSHVQLLDELISELELKRGMASQFDEVEKLMSGVEEGEGTVIVGERNRVAFEVLDKQLAAGKKHLAIFYGAAHLTDMEQRLLKRGRDTAMRRARAGAPQRPLFERPRLLARLVAEAQIRQQAVHGGRDGSRLRGRRRRGVGGCGR